MTANIIFTKQDLLTIGLFNAVRAKKLKESVRLYWIIMSVISIILFGAFYKDNDGYLSAAFFFISIYFLFLYPVNQWRSYRKKTLEAIEDEHADSLSKEYILDITDKHIEFKSETYSAKIDVTEIDAIYEMENYYCIYYKSRNSTIIPKRLFNEEELQRLMAQIAQTIKIAVQNVKDWKWSFFYKLPMT